MSKITGQSISVDKDLLIEIIETFMRRVSSSKGFTISEITFDEVRDLFYVEVIDDLVDFDSMWLKGRRNVPATEVFKRTRVIQQEVDKLVIKDRIGNDLKGGKKKRRKIKIIPKKIKSLKKEKRKISFLGEEIPLLTIHPG